MRAAGLPWTELFELHVLKNIRKLVHRRWGLGLGYVDAATGRVRPPRHTTHSTRRGLCPLILDRDAGRASCDEAGASALDCFREHAARGRLRSRPITLTCHAGLTEIAAPVVVDGALVGALLCGGFAQGEADAAAATARAATLQVDPDALSDASDAHPRLGDRELSFVGELIEEAASEIATYLGERAARGSGARGEDGPSRRGYGSIVGRSQVMQDLYALLDKIVETESTVLLTGENGTGKELVARAIHVGSRRKRERFVVQNCSAFNDNLLDSELFGHKRGAFTGAVTDKQGLFQVADGGTFFLDEIGDMSPSLQVKVLRVIQEGTFTAVGDTELERVDVRLIAATNRDLEGMVQSGAFREDLYYRVNVINVVLPPLREREGDVEVLVEHFLREHAEAGTPKRLAPECAAELAAYRWPGNVRELENEIERLVVLSGDEPVIDAAHLSPRIRDAVRTPDPEALERARSLPQAVRALERRMIRDALERHGWNKTRAAADLQISRRNLIRLVQKYELDGERTV